MNSLEQVEGDETDQALAVIKRCAAEIAEHCDSVQIIAVKQKRGASTRFTHGEDCIFQRLGATRYWLDLEDHKARLDAEDDRRES